MNGPMLADALGQPGKARRGSNLAARGHRGRHHFAPFLQARRRRTRSDPSGRGRERRGAKAVAKIEAGSCLLPDLRSSPSTSLTLQLHTSVDGRMTADKIHRRTREGAKRAPRTAKETKSRRFRRRSRSATGPSKRCGGASDRSDTTFRGEEICRGTFERGTRLESTSRDGGVESANVAAAAEDRSPDTVQGSTAAPEDRSHVAAEAAEAAPGRHTSRDRRDLGATLVEALPAGRVHRCAASAAALPPPCFALRGAQRGGTRAQGEREMELDRRGTRRRFGDQRKKRNRALDALIDKK